MRRANGGGAVTQREIDLTDRQRQVLRLIAAGKTNAEIGEALGISLDGAKWHVSEILAKLGVDSREEAAAWWRAREGWRPRIGRALRALLPGAAWAKAGAGLLGLAGIAAALIAVATLRDSGGSTNDASASSPTASVTPTSAAAAACAAGSVTLTVSAYVGGNASSAVLHASASAPCFLDARVTARVIDPSGSPLPVLRNGLVLSLRSHLPTPEDVGGVYLSNWCGDQPPAHFEFTFGSQVLTTPAAGDPGCQAGLGQPALSAYASPVFEYPPRPSPPAGLTAIAGLPNELRVHVYPDAPGGDGSCASLVNWMIPATAAPEAGTVVSCYVTDRLFRYRFSAAPDGSAYLDRVSLLLPLALSLPQPTAGWDCDDLRDWVILASASPAGNAWVGVCDVQPLSRGAASRGPVQVWALLVEGSPTSFPTGTPCWQLSIYLGSVPEAKTVDVQCELE